MVGIDGKGIRADFYNKNPKHYKINIDNTKKTNTGYTTKHLSDAKHKANFVKLDAQLKDKSDAEITSTLKTIAGNDNEITKAELEAYLNRTNSSSNLDAIKNQAEAGRTINNAPDSLYKTMIAHDSNKNTDSVKKDLKDLFKTGKASYKDVEKFLTTKLGWTKEAANAVFFEYVKDNKEIKLSEFLFNIDIYVRDFNENVREKMPGFESGKYFQKYTKFNITREHEVDQVFNAAFNSNDTDVKQCREEIAQSYAKKYTSAELSLSTNWTAEMKQALYIKLAEKAIAKVQYTVEDQPASGKKKATTKTVAGFYKVDHNKLLEKYFKELLEQKQTEEKKAEESKTAGKTVAKGKRNADKKGATAKTDKDTPAGDKKKTETSGKTAVSENKGKAKQF